jgi:acyl-CoA synthetase (AMP-forming)/AMP-acid ligase II
VLRPPADDGDLFAVERAAEARDGAGHAAGVACGTTGTWGEPQLLVFEADQVARWTSAEAPPEEAVLARSVAHVSGLRSALASLAADGRARLLERWAPRAVLRHLAGRHTDRLCASGPQLTELAVALARRGSEGAHVAVLDVGGGRLFRGAAGALGTHLGAAVLNRYTSSEAGGWATASEARAAADHEPLDLGPVVPGVDLVIGEPLDEGGHGLVRVHGPAAATARLAPGWRRDGPPMTIVTGWDTGDLGRLDGGGRLELLGRARDRFRTRAGHVDPVLVELALAEHPAIADVAVTLRPHVTEGAVAVAITVPADPESPPFLHEVVAQLAHLPQHAHPRAQAVVERLPLTGSGQLNRRMLAHDEVER